MPIPVRTLILEDNSNDARLLVRELKRAGFEPDWQRVHGEAEFLARLDAAPDLILADFSLPQFDALRALRLVRDRGLDIPFIIVSGSIGEEIAVGAMQQGATDYLLKDRLGRLGQAVTLALERQQLRREMRQAEEARRSAEALFRNLVEHSLVGIHIVQDGRYAYVNPKLAEIFGYTVAEVLALGSWLDLIAVADRDLVAAHVRQRESGEVSSARYVFRGLRKDGAVIDAEVFGNRTELNGRPAVIGTLIDITERRLAEAARERLIAILEATTDLVAISQVDGPVSYMNAAGRKLLGIGLEEDLFLLDHRPDFARKVIAEEAIPTAVRAGVWSGETVLLNRSGEAIPVSQVLIAHKTPAGAVEFLSTVARDIRREKLLEEQLRQAQKMEAVGRLAGGIAHDFNNLLTVITGCSEVLLSELRPHDPLHDLVEDIRHAGTRAAGLTRQLLAFSRKQVLVPVVLNLDDLLAEMEKLLGRLIGEDVDLVVRRPSDLWPVKVDAGQMEQVVMNLAVNARDAMPQGGKLTIETANVELDEAYVAGHHGAAVGDHVLLAVSDTGCGMDAGTRARIFEPFFTTKGPERGTGLGLAVVHGIVKQSGGHIDVYSERGVGTTFKIYLPRVRIASPANKTPDTVKAPSRGTETVLLVEDEEGVRSFARLALQRNGYKVLEARHGGEALLTCEQYNGTVDVLVTDVVMPNMSGRQLAERLLTLRPGLKVLFLSGYTDDAVVRHGILEADTAFLQKPFTLAALAQKVREVLDRQPSVGTGSCAGR